MDFLCVQFQFTTKLSFLLPIAYFIYHKIIDYDARLIVLDELIEALENK